MLCCDGRFNTYLKTCAKSICVYKRMAVNVLLSRNEAQVNRSTGLLYEAYIEWCCSMFFRLCNFRPCPNITQIPSQPTADTTVIE